MKERLMQLMNHLGLTAARFADDIGVQRSGISHILSGRNQPSYDFILRTIKKFPDIDIEWLLTGNGSMVKKKTVTPESVAKIMTSETNREKETANLLKGIKEVTNVNNIDRIVVFYKNGTFDHYTPAGKE